MTSSHRHSSTGKAVAAGDTDARLDALEAAVKALQAPVIVPAPTPTLPAGAVVLAPGADVKAACTAGAVVVLRGGTYRFGFGSAYRPGFTLMAYPGEAVTIDGTGLDPHFLYLDGGATSIRDLSLTGFHPLNSGIIAAKSGSFDAQRVKIRGSATDVDTTSHAYYFLGTATATITDGDVDDIPGCAVQVYNGTPSAIITGGTYRSRSFALMVWNGTVSAKAALSGVTGDVRWNKPSGAVFTDRGCTGTGTNGAVRVL